ncbi:MAG: arginine--tRNA ligase, partial [Candidatus Eremiobacterota bacterium]
MSGRVLQKLSANAREAFARALNVEADPDVRPTSDARFGDYQINGVLPLAKQLKDNPRMLAERVLGQMPSDGMVEAATIAGPGFINLRISPQWLAAEIGRRAADPRLGVEPVARPERVVVDFSSPNVAKRMHVGHLRSTIIGDALVRTLRFLGHRVVGDNHLGDWGTQFGMLIWAWKQEARPEALESDPLGELERLYKLGSERARAEESVAEAARQELARLQAGDPENRALWQKFVDLSRQDAQGLYARLNVGFDTWHGESHYHDALPGVVERLLQSGVAREDQGAVAVFFDDHPDLADKPFLVRKRDGAYLYATTDLATLEERIRDYDPDIVVYVVDVRQSLHFHQLFETARRLGMLPGGRPRLAHVGFGMMLGLDGRPFKTREGGTVTLRALLDEAQERILPIVAEKWPDASPEEQRSIAARVGIAAVKYADLCQHRTTDYKFDWNKLLAADGNTGPYLLYALVRIRSVFREHVARFDSAYVPDGLPVSLREPAERNLALTLLRLGDVLDKVAEALTPHVLCEYLYDLARAFNTFYHDCPVLKGE